MKMHWGKMKEWLDNGHYGFYGRAWGDNQDAFVQKESSNVDGFIWFIWWTEKIHRF